ncbi:MAG: hypothetical protein HY289_12050 [Planctomycetes bacterium]|nr:hypothetical protein [Planctomycetota bacterium]
MIPRWLIPLGVVLVVNASAFAQGAGVKPVAFRPTEVGYLVTSPLQTTMSAPRPVAYQPHPGDIVLYDDFNKLHHLVFKIANTAGPLHVAIVVARPDGSPALLDLTGPKVVTAKVQIIDVDKRFGAFTGDILIRRLREPLTLEQSRDLTAFAQAQEGKSFALPRVLLQGTPFCPRTGLRKALFGHTYLDRKRWFCSELVVAACANVHLVDGKKCCANATYPRDLAFDETLDLSAIYLSPIRWSPTPVGLAR